MYVHSYLHILPLHICTNQSYVTSQKANSDSYISRLNIKHILTIQYIVYSDSDKSIIFINL